MPYDYNTPFNPRIEKNAAFTPEAISTDSKYIINYEITRVYNCYIHLDSTQPQPHSQDMRDLHATITTLHDINHPDTPKETIFHYINKAYDIINDIDDTLIEQYTLFKFR